MTGCGILLGICLARQQRASWTGKRPAILNRARRIDREIRPNTLKWANTLQWGVSPRSDWVLVSKRLQLRVFRTAGAVALELVRHADRWLAIAWLPWLLGTLSIILLQRLFLNVLQYGTPPYWVQSLTLAPFTSMIFVQILRNILQGTPAIFGTIYLSRQFYLTTFVVALISMLISAFYWSYGIFIKSLMTKFDNDVLIYMVYPLRIVNFLVYSTIISAFYIIFAIIIDHDRIDIKFALKISRTHFYKFFGLSFLIVTTYRVVQFFYTPVVQIVSSNQQALSQNQLLEDTFISSLISSLIWLPLDLLADILPAVAIGLIYEALRSHDLLPHPNPS